MDESNRNYMAKSKVKSDYIDELVVLVSERAKKLTVNNSVHLSQNMHSAKLIWVTPDAEKLVGKIARVSNPKNEDNPDVKGLLKYLIKQHWSPFEMASMCVEIHTTRAISAQILRHRSFSFQEFLSDTLSR